MTLLLFYVRIVQEGEEKLKIKMSFLSQNKKIAIAALAIFIVSFSVMLFFLGGNSLEIENTHTNVLNSSHNSETHDEVNKPDPAELSFITDSEGTFKYTANGFCKLMKLSCSEFEDKKYYDYINSGDLNDLILVQTKLVKEGDKIEAMGPYRMIQGNDEILVLLNAEPILDKDGKVESIIYHVKDLTEQVENLNHKETDKGESKAKDWTRILYPKIKNMSDDAESRLMVDKITYKED